MYESRNFLLISLSVKNIIPGRPEQKQNDWANQPGVTVYLHEDKKSSIPIPVKTAALAVQAKGSFPLQMRKISPNMKIGAVVPHHAEYGKKINFEIFPYTSNLLRYFAFPFDIRDKNRGLLHEKKFIGDHQCF